MAPFDYLPGSVSTHTFLRRLSSDGVYDRLAEAFSGMGTAAIANADVNDTFFQYTPNEMRPDCHYYRDSESAEYSGNLFGEILGQAHGTFVGARGNHYPGPNAARPNQITDQSKARCSIAIGCPSFAPDRLKTIWHNQLCTFVGLRDSEMDSSISVKEIVKSTTSGRGIDAITLTGGLMYTSPRRHRDMKSGECSELSTVVPLYKKRPLPGQDVDSSSSSVAATGVDQDTLIWPSGMHCVLLVALCDHVLGNDIYVGAEYDHRLMPDSGGRLFALKKAKLVQPDWRDISGSLITPWSNYASLRPGTLIIANVSIRTFIVRGKASRKPERKIFQALINHLQVVAESDVHVSVPEPLRLKSAVGCVSAEYAYDSGEAAFVDLKTTFANCFSAMDVSMRDGENPTVERGKKARTQ
ncbi:uncharacterized protein C8R40DRAFT_1174053 [Lentinula edodes]|uniref:uncharacterized protein n=1 Tax=Lentinula edodes TaxID=5353 RepID=UPI001E8E454E|nr:uncharacterized protein C8R40DRAFT_1174053 [Lentinula edodes]KAH7871981.1 hypothetical protein C8R40DRAFT_1174053 [Lentinula edodes]